MNPTTRNLALNGARGRMGTRITALAREHHDINQIVALNASGKIDGENEDFTPIHAVIDFSSPQGVENARQCARQHHCALLVGTTGLNDTQINTLKDDAQHIPVMIAPNTSLGVAVLKTLVKQAATLLGSDFQIDLVDIHHTHKKDAPSGTAKALAEAINQQRENALPPDRIHALRTGGIVGNHAVRFTSPFEEIVLEHNALTRDVFAAGALRAALWLANQQPGLYTIDDAWNQH